MAEKHDLKQINLGQKIRIMNNKKISLFIVDDHRIRVEGLKSLLAMVETIEVVGEAPNGQQALAKLNHNVVDIVLMNIEMPFMKCCEDAQLITDKYPNIKLIAFTRHNDKALIKRMLRIGVWGYVLKDTGKNELVNAIETVSRGKKYYSQEVPVVPSKPGGSRNNIKEHHRSTRDHLTRREAQVLEGITLGLSNNKIGEKLEISARTVDSHRTNIMKKLGVHNVAELVRYAMLNGLI